MDFENLAQTWDRFAESDPLWAILTWDGKKQNHWDREEFYRVGEGAVQRVLGQARECKGLIGRHKALDFGCGVGRLTFPLAAHFDQSHGVDISAAMLAHARQYQAERKIANCSFHLNQEPDLRCFANGEFDFILSLIVLQHMEPAYFTEYIAEFVRILRPDGMLVFQLPDFTENRAAYEQFTADTEPEMEVFGMARDEVVRVVRQNGARVLEVLEDNCCGDELRSYRYFVTR